MAAPQDRQEDDDVRTLVEVVEHMTGVGDDDAERIDVAEILSAVGQRSFGPMLLVPGLIVLSPISGIPGVPTLGGIAVFLIAGQLLIGRKCFWVPQFLARRTIPKKRLNKARSFLLPIARVVDKLVWPRLSILTRGPFTYLIAATCIAIAIVMPPLEAILFANVVTSVAISAFGLALVAHDGLLAAVAFILTGAAFWFAIDALVL